LLRLPLEIASAAVIKMAALMGWCDRDWARAAKPREASGPGGGAQRPDRQSTLEACDPRKGPLLVLELLVNPM